jgi:hypothetical protein
MCFACFKEKSGFSKKDLGLFAVFRGGAAQRLLSWGMSFRTVIAVTEGTAGTMA